MNWLNSAWSYKCPRCRQGDIFTKPFQFSKPLDMPDTCAVCGQKTMPEPGFYYGSMYISYIVTGFLYIAIVVGLIVAFGMSVEKAFVILLVFVALTYFKTARLARSFWIHIMVKYDKDAGKQGSLKAKTFQ